jgi:Ras-related protein Rab-32
LQLWDIAGQDRFARLTRAYFHRARGAIVVCDVTREGTFEAVAQWKTEIDTWASNHDDGSGGPLPVVLLANKCDLLTDVQQSFIAGAQMEKVCRDHNFAAWFVTSAKDGSNVDEAILKLVGEMGEVDRASQAALNHNAAVTGGRSLPASSRMARSAATTKASRGRANSESFKLGEVPVRQKEAGSDCC